MRRVSLSMLTPDMRLARPIFYKNSLLLKRGTGNLLRYAHKLAEIGLYSVYVEDDLSEDIEINDAVTYETRLRCRQAVAETFEKIKNGKGVDSMMVSDVISQLLEETMNQPNIIISLNDIGASSDDTMIHSVNVTVYGVILAQKLGCSAIELKNLAEGILLHDIGKITLDQKILYKKGTLTPEEFEHIKSHPLRGYEILKRDPLLTESTRQVALLHHERLDGSGYPYGLAGDEVNKLTRITGIADVYEALTADRCYRRSMTPSKATNILTEYAVDKLDAVFTAMFFQNIAIYPNGAMVMLSDGNYGIVKEQNPGYPFQPVIRVLECGRDGNRAKYDLDLSKTLNVTIKEDDPRIMFAEQNQNIQIM